MASDPTTPATTPEPDLNDLVVLTTVPVAPLAQPLVDFLASESIAAFISHDDTGLDATQGIALVVAYRDLPRAKALLDDFWAANDGRRDAM